MNKDNTELQRITKVLDELKNNEIGKSVNFCNRKRIINPFELVMSLITALGDQSVYTVTDLHRYFVKLTKTDVQNKPFYNQLSKPEGKNEPTYWATNLDREQFSANAVIKVYKLRWQIELLFKEWK
jgi:IS4 transposase